MITESMYSIKRLVEIHKKACPDTMLSERAVRNAVRCGQLPSIKSGNRYLIRADVFDKWLRGGLDD